MVELPGVIDLCSGAGGMAVGLSRAGWRVVLGVDIKPQPHYPFPFRQADVFALDWAELAAENGAVAISVSPMCQDHSITRNSSGIDHGTAWQLPESRRRLELWGGLWVIENVPGAPMRTDYRLCGCMFGLGAAGRALYRERWFETSWRGFDLRPPCAHTLKALTVCGNGGQSWERDELGRYPTITDRREAMGIEWMTRNELGQAVPPAFGRYVGERMLAQVVSKGNQSS